MSKKLNLAVIGAGVFGNYHCAKIHTHPMATLIGIVDFDAERASALAHKYKTQTYTTIESVLPNVDAIIIALPASAHGDIGHKALNAGKHVLIEKPLTADRISAASLVKIAQEKDLVLQVGHQERFVLKAIGIDKIIDPPIRIESKRMSPFSVRNTDVSVTLDLMIHDIDMVLSLMGTPETCHGHSLQIKSSHADAALGFLKFANGGTARLEASRIETESQRSMHIIYPNGDIHIDFNAKTLTHSTPFDLNLDYGQDFMAKDSLGAADDAFIRACLLAEPVPISGEDGLAALEIALKIDEID